MGEGYRLGLVGRALAGARAEPLPESCCPMRAAVAMILAPVEPGGELGVAMIRRTRDPRDPWSGQMGFPGGRREPGDLDDWATAIREVREEIGLDLTGATRAGRLPDLQAMSRGKPIPMAIAPLVFTLGEQVPLGTSDEVDEALWIPLAAFRDPDLRTSIDRTFGSRTITMPGVDYRGRVVWGLSLMMLHGLLRALDRTRASGSTPGT